MIMILSLLKNNLNSFYLTQPLTLFSGFSNMCVYSMDKDFLSKILKLINSGLTILEKKKITKSDTLQLNIHIYSTLKENPEALKMFADYMQKLEKGKGDIHSIIGKHSFGFSSSRKSMSRKSSRSSSRSSTPSPSASSKSTSNYIQQFVQNLDNLNPKL